MHSKSFCWFYNAQMFWLKKKITVFCPHLQVIASKRILYDSRCLRAHMQTTSALTLYSLSPRNDPQSTWNNSYISYFFLFLFAKAASCCSLMLSFSSTPCLLLFGCLPPQLAEKLGCRFFPYKLPYTLLETLRWAEHTTSFLGYEFFSR